MSASRFQIKCKQVLTSNKLIELALIASILVVALMLRFSLISFQGNDYKFFLSRWYDFIQMHGGFASFKYWFSDYTPLYLYYIALMTYIPLPKIWLIKGISIGFDFLLAWMVYLIVRLKYERSYLPLISGLLVLFAPTIFFNSALWGQSDGIYTTFALAGLYCLMTSRSALALLLFGIALSLKLQAIFLFPLFVLLLLQREILVRHFLIIPAVYLLTILPAWLLGRPLLDLVLIYFNQVHTYLRLTLGAPNFFQWIPASSFSYMYRLGILLALGSVLFVMLIVFIRHRKVSPEVQIRLAFLFALVIPFFLPEMHERYFYLADVLSIVYACYFPKRFYLSILVQLASFFSYLPFLLGITVIPTTYLPFVILAVIIVVVVDLVKIPDYDSMERE